MDGYAVLKEAMQADDALRNVPTVLVTAQDGGAQETATDLLGITRSGGLSGVDLTRLLKASSRRAHEPLPATIERLQERRLGDRLRHERGGAKRLGELLLLEHGADYHGHFATVRLAAQQVEYLPAVGGRQHHVQDDGVDPALGDEAEGLLARRRRDDAAGGRFEVAGEEPQHVRIVVHDEDDPRAGDREHDEE